MPQQAALHVTSLLRGNEGANRHGTAVGRLFDLVTEWGPDAETTITIQRATHNGSTTVDITPSGAVPPQWQADIKWALAELAEVTRTRGTRAPGAPAHLLELRMTRDLPGDQPGQPEEVGDGGLRDAYTTELERQRRIRTANPWPRAYHALLADLLNLNVNGLVVRYRLSGASTLERTMLGDALEATWSDARGPRQDYLGQALRVRSLVGASEPIPARVRATLRQWATGLTVVPVSPADAPQAWNTGRTSLAGYAVPVGAAAAMLRLPVTEQQTFPGLVTKAPAIPSRPLDPVPHQPTRPVRLGKAHAGTGLWVDASLDLDDLVHHAYIQGSSGAGKSTLLVTLALAIQAAGGSYTLLDPEGSTVDALTLRTPARHADSTRIVRHGTDQLDVPLTFFNSGVDNDVMIELFAEMIQRAVDPGQEGIVGPRWRRWFALVANGVAKLFGDQATLVTVAAVASDIERVKLLGTRLISLDRELGNRILSEYGGLSKDNASELTSWAASKFHPVLSSSRTRAALGATGAGIDVLDLMDSGRSLAIDLGMHRLGTTGSRIVGALWLLKYWAAMPSHQNRHNPHVILVDEAHLFQYGALPQLLAQARKFGIGIVIATQHLGQLTGELADALESNTGTLVSLRTGIQSASRASLRLQGWPVEDLVRLPKLTAAATLSRDGVTTEPFTLHIDHFDRLRHQQQNGTIGPNVAATILRASRQAAATDAANHHAPLTDEEIVARLLQPSSLDEPGYTNEVGGPNRHAVRPTGAAADPGPADTNFLDEWLAQRRNEPATIDDCHDTAQAT